MDLLSQYAFLAQVEFKLPLTLARHFKGTKEGMFLQCTYDSSFTGIGIKHKTPEYLIGYQQKLTSNDL